MIYQQQDAKNALNLSVGLSKDVGGAMELALIRPDLVTDKQIQILAQELKNRTRLNLQGLQGVAFGQNQQVRA